MPQIPWIQYWRSSRGGISERGPDSEETHFRGIYDNLGNLMVVMTHNTDISDSWERERDILLYAMTH